MNLQPKTKFFISNFIKGLLWLCAFVAIFIIFKRYIKPDFLAWLKPLYDNTLLIFTIYTLSEIIIGLIPPEIFFIWATRTENVTLYIQYAVILAVISYGAGLLAFWFGKKLNETLIFRFLKRKYLRKHSQYLNNYGFFLIIVASMTPIPYSGTAMLMGSVNYPFKRYFIYALARFIRFTIYALVFWEVMSYEMTA